MFLQKVQNSTLHYITSSTLLTNLQKLLLNEIPTELGVQCMLQMWRNYSYDNISQGYLCNAVWDDVYCWPPIPAGTEIRKLCSETFHQVHPYYASHMEGYAKRTCLSNGTWTEGRKSDFTQCRKSYEAFLKIEEDDKFLVPMVRYMLFYGSIISLICLGTSLLIFKSFRCLWCNRLTVNIHLFLSLVLRFIMLVIIAEPFVLGRYPNYTDVDILCKAIHVVFLYATVASIGWMFIQGIFINISLSTKMFPAGNSPTHMKVYCIVGWVVPAVLTLAYVTAMVFKEKQEKCWKGYSEMNEIWILLVPIIFALAGNGMFLINILRILLKKVRKSRTEDSQIKAAAKATAILFPVLGINNLIVLYNPRGEYNKYFVTVNTFFASTQGIFVALVQCFTNKEVITAIGRSLDRIKARREANLNFDNANRNLQQQESPSIIPIPVMPSPQTNDQTDSESVEEAV